MGNIMLCFFHNQTRSFNRVIRLQIGVMRPLTDDWWEQNLLFTDYLSYYSYNQARRNDPSLVMISS